MRNSRGRLPAALLAAGIAILTGTFAGAQSTGYVGSSGKVYEPLDTPSTPQADDPARRMLEEMRRLQAEMDERFNTPLAPFDPFSRSSRLGSFYDLPQSPAFAGATAPQRLSFREENGRYVAELALPHGDVENLQVKVDGRMLRISGTRTEKTERTEAGRRSRSTMSSSFQQSVTLPTPVKPEQLKVDRVDGRVVISIPKN